MPKIAAIVGSRHIVSGLVPLAVVPSIMAKLHTSGFSFVTGCASGIDTATKQAGIKHGFKLSVFAVAGAKTPASLRNRTQQVITKASHVFAFPKSYNVQHSGTWLAIGLAIRQGKQVFVYPPACPGKPSIPASWGVSMQWQTVKKLGFSWHHPQYFQTSLF